MRLKKIDIAILNIGANLKLLRQSKNLSRETVANEVGITVTYLGMIENNKKRPTLTTLAKICSYYQIFTLSEFFNLCETQVNE